MNASNHKKERLTNRLITFLQSLAIKQGKRFYRADGKNNLAVRVSKQGLAVFTVTFYNQQNKKTEKVIGHFPAITVNEARILASEFFINAQVGKEANLKDFSQVPTVSDIYKDWYERNCKKFSITTAAKKDLRAHKYILSKFGSCFFEDLKPGDFFKAWEELENTGKFDSIRRLCIIVKEIYIFAINTGRVSKMADLSHLNSNYYFPPATHYKSLNPKDLVRFFVDFLELHSPDDFIFKVTLFAFYTLLRQKEIASIKWEWVDLDNRVIHIESEVMKSRRSFDVPITNQMLKILESLPKTNEYVFNSRVVNGKAVKMHDNYLGSIFRKKGFNKIFNVHGIRAIGRTWMQIENIDPLIAESCLSHAINNSTLSAYIRVDFLFDKRLEIMSRWSDFVESNLNSALNYLNNSTDKTK